MSGGGKSTAIKALEDAGWFCIDNLPVLLVPKLLDLVVDTTRMNVHELRDAIIARFGAAGEADALNVTLVTFGYRNGIPANSDLVFDVRFLPNPYFVEGLKPYPGTDPRVSEWVLGR